jgi:magnesium chelatase family protein
MERYKDEPGIYTNAQMTGQHLKKYCLLNGEAENLLQKAMEKFQLSARAFDRIIKVSRTIADLQGEKNISLEHISEAIQYRSLDKSSWGKFKN